MSGNNPITPLGSAPPSADEFKIYTQTSQLKFLTRAVQPPSQLYVDVSDDIVVSMASSLAGESVTVSYRLLRADGEVVLGQFQVTAAALRTIATHSEDLAEGFLLSVSCKAALATTRGQTFVRIFLTDPALGANQPTYMLMSDYVSNQFAPAYPFGRVLTPQEGPGFFHSVIVANPAAGANWSQACPANARWKINSGVANFQASVAVGNRHPGVLLTLSGAVIFDGSSGDSMAAGSFNTITYSPTINIPNTGQNHFLVPLPATAVLLAGQLIGSNTFNEDVGDQYTNIALGVEEWLDNV